MKKLIILFALLLVQSIVFADKAPSSLAKWIEAKRQTMKIPGASVAVINNGKIICAQGFGYADIENKRKVTEDTLFQTASITKTLTAAAVLKVLDQNKIALDEPVNRYLSEWKIPENQYNKKVPVTFRLLLNHTGAISNPYPKGGLGPKDKLPTLLEVFKGEPPATNPPFTVTRVPGTVYQYCNGCYAILQGALEDIAHESFPALMKKQIFDPAKMSSSRFDNDFFLKDESKIALPYDPNLKRYIDAPKRDPILATGFLWSTATDLAKFNIAVTQALKKSNALITQSLAEELITPSQNPIHSLGFFIGDKYGDDKVCGQYIYHTGANVGYLTSSSISKDGQQGAVVLINISPEWNAKDYPQFKFIKETFKQIGQYYGWR